MDLGAVLDLHECLLNHARTSSSVFPLVVDEGPDGDGAVASADSGVEEDDEAGRHVGPHGVQRSTATVHMHHVHVVRHALREVAVHERQLLEG